jgi:polysaccharide export outer membrane protein
MKITRSLSLVTLLAALVAASSSQAADEYVLGPEDVLNISVWDSPTLSRTVTVRAGGLITFPPIGDVPAAGKTAAGLARLLEERLTEFLRRPTQVTVEVTSFQSQRVTVSGAVASPGRLGFERIPGLMEVLGAAGGLGPTANLARVQIFRTEGKQRATITVDLSGAMATGDISGLPELQANDIVFVPATMAEGGTRSDAAYVAGEVRQPGAYSVGSGLDLLKLLSLSGGPLETADISRVQVVTQDPAGRSFVAIVDLEQFLTSGETDFLVRPGDAVRVPSVENTAGRIAWTATRELLSASRDILNLFLIWDILND